MRAKPKNLFSFDFEVSEKGRLLCLLDHSYWRECASFSLAGRTHTLGRERGWGAFWVREGGARGEVLCRATKVSVFRRRFSLRIDREEFVLEPRSLFGYGYVLRSRGQVVGSIQRVRFLSREMAVDLPEELPVAIRVFLLWLVLLMKRRARRSSS
jgi:hypothetical protein